MEDAINSIENDGGQIEDDRSLEDVRNLVKDSGQNKWNNEEEETDDRNSIRDGGERIEDIRNLEDVQNSNVNEEWELDKDDGERVKNAQIFVDVQVLIEDDGGRIEYVQDLEHVEESRLVNRFLNSRKQ